MRILVTYATRFGSTAGVAEAVGSALRDCGARVDVLPMREVARLSDYDAVVAGSAINSGAWLPEAMEFVQEHQAALRSKPLAAFLVCMTLTMRDGSKYRDHVQGWMAPVRAIVEPVSLGLFGGALDIGRMPSAFDRLRFGWSVKLGFWKEGDHRDWEAIRQWSAQILPLLQRQAARAN